MTAPVKILFDECISDLAVKEIARVVEISYDGCEFKHIKEYQKQGIPDEQWVPEIAEEKCWIVVSGDRSKQSKTSKSKYYKGEKLRTVCKQHNVTLVELSQKIHHLPTTQKVGVILSVWPDIMKVSKALLGSRHLIRFKGTKPGGPIIIQVDPPLLEIETES